MGILAEMDGELNHTTARVPQRYLVD